MSPVLKRSSHHLILSCAVVVKAEACPRAARRRRPGISSEPGQDLRRTSDRRTPSARDPVEVRRLLQRHAYTSHGIRTPISVPPGRVANGVADDVQNSDDCGARRKRRAEAQTLQEIPSDLVTASRWHAPRSSSSTTSQRRRRMKARLSGQATALGQLRFSSGPAVDTSLFRIEANH